MAISPTCDNCGRELTEYGAILLGPPNAQDMAKKLHLYTDCYAKIVRTMQHVHAPEESS